MKNLNATSLSATQKLAIKINRLKASKSALEDQIKQKDYKNRKKRTRTLIQMGGLIKLSGLMELCDLHEGETYKTRYQHRNKSAILLRLLVDTANRFEPNDSKMLQKQGLKWMGK